MASALAAFDIQVYEPNASVQVTANGDILESSDVGSVNGLGTPFALGGYVDLGKGNAAGPGILGGATSAAYTEAIYDTGTSLYNRVGENNQASNGVDDGGIPGVVDDVFEQNALPPYNVPIRGLKFSMRVLEPVTKQVRQLTVRKSFVPES